MLPTSSSAKGRSGANPRPNSVLPQYLRRIIKVIFSMRTKHFADLIMICCEEFVAGFGYFSFPTCHYYVGEIDRINRGTNIKGYVYRFCFQFELFLLVEVMGVLWCLKLEFWGLELERLVLAPISASL